jgi:predicted dehydrogenase
VAFHLKKQKGYFIKIKKKNFLAIRVGFNHRYHPAFLKAKKLVKNNKIGKIMYIRAVYGHGGRLNYNKEWRFKKNFSGGGELIDKGSHLIDLSRIFLGNLKINS